MLEEVKAGDEYVSMGSLCPAGKITILNRSLFNIESIRLDSTLKKKKIMKVKMPEKLLKIQRKSPVKSHLMNRGSFKRFSRCLKDYSQS